MFIKKLGLYAAAISTMISYFVMLLYRHIDLKKYITIRIEKGLLLKTILIFAFAIFFYYYNHLIGNIISLAVVCLYAFLLNRSLLKEGADIALRKLHLKR